MLGAISSTLQKFCPFHRQRVFALRKPNTLSCGENTLPYKLKEIFLAMAVAGGLLADRMAWVFVGGYQSAIRHTFV